MNRTQPLAEQRLPFIFRFFKKMMIIKKIFWRIRRDLVCYCNFGIFFFFLYFKACLEALTKLFSQLEMEIGDEIVLQKAQRCVICFHLLMQMTKVFEQRQVRNEEMKKILKRISNFYMGKVQNSNLELWNCFVFFLFNRFSLYHSSMEDPLSMGLQDVCPFLIDYWCPNPNMF